MQNTDSLIAAIDNVLPQTQCRQCGSDGCLAYARAIVNEGVPINRCAPGGAAGIKAMARLLDTDVLPLDPDYGHEVPFAVARIRAAECIGCSWCVKVCPTDAIAGAPKHLYGVLENQCTGCALCLSACPMECIDMVETGKDWTHEDAVRAKALYETARRRRADRARRENAKLEALRKRTTNTKHSLVADIMARAKKSRA